MKDANSCQATVKINGEILKCCRSDKEHEKKGLWHRKGRTYW